MLSLAYRYLANSNFDFFLAQQRIIKVADLFFCSNDADLRGAWRKGAWGRRGCWDPRDTGAAPRSGYPPASPALYKIRVSVNSGVARNQNQTGSGFNLGGSRKQCCGSGSGIDAFLTPRSGIRDGNKSLARIRDEHPGSYFWELTVLLVFWGLKIIKFFDADLNPRGSCQPWIRDPGWKKIGSRISIPDPQHWKPPGSATLKEKINWPARTKKHAVKILIFFLEDLKLPLGLRVCIRVQIQWIHILKTS